MSEAVKRNPGLAKVEWLEGRRLYSGSSASAAGESSSSSLETSSIQAAATITKPTVTATITNGVFTKVAYNGVTYMDSTQNAGGQSTAMLFQITVTDLQGNNRRDVWTPTSQTWNATTSTLVNTYPFGTATIKLSSAADRITWDVTLTNTSTDTQIIGYNFMPTTIKFGTTTPTFPEYAQVNGVDGLQAVRVNDRLNAVVLVNESPGAMRSTTIRTYGTDTSQGVYRVRLGTEILAGDTASYPTSTPQVTTGPGQSDHFTLSLRFAPVASTTPTIVADQVAVTRSVQPMAFKWTDRRVIAAYWPSSPSTDTGRMDTSTPAGVAAYQAAMLQMANDAVAEAKKYNYQGIVFWDLEGTDQYKNNYAYMGDPSMIPVTNPAFDAIADQFFSILTAGGVKFGLTVRNATAVPNPNGVGYTNVTPADPIAEYERKIAYAVNRWGASMFYIDSIDLLNPLPIEAAQRMFPNVLLIPEEWHQAGTAFNAVSAPFIDTRNLFPITNPVTRAVYPDGFSTLWLGDMTATSLNENKATVVSAVKAGDILMGHLFTDAKTLATLAASAGVSLTHRYTNPVILGGLGVNDAQAPGVTETPSAAPSTKPSTTVPGLGDGPTTKTTGSAPARPAIPGTGLASATAAGLRPGTRSAVSFSPAAVTPSQQNPFVGPVAPSWLSSGSLEDPTVLSRNLLSLVDAFSDEKIRATSVLSAA